MRRPVAASFKGTAHGCGVHVYGGLTQCARVAETLVQVASNVSRRPGVAIWRQAFIQTLTHADFEALARVLSLVQLDLLRVQCWEAVRSTQGGGAFPRWLLSKVQAVRK